MVDRPSIMPFICTSDLYLISFYRVLMVTSMFITYIIGKENGVGMSLSSAENSTIVGFSSDAFSVWETTGTS